ncbi:MAG: NAD-dependent succinate-semialdehyde dehydrogenase [Verrucomicrobiota bacterium]|nr:NAD-dependent succinate-semialdehyde dehydrogenase [Limisphaera sp.]MDW8381510.1 NAD-dependent succinate-semialdehyde dehydrogenase [Verrucomicrobiota bacterium]
MVTFQAFDPFTGQLLREVPVNTPSEVQSRLSLAAAASSRWRRTPVTDRCGALRALADRLRDRRDELANLMAEEMGKPILQGRAEIEKCAWVCEFYADQAEALLQPERVPTEWSRSYVAFEPLGPILGIMPWNFPFWQVFRAAAPILAAGNVFLLKHASNVPGCAAALEDLARAANLPPGVFQVLWLTSDRLDDVIQHPAVRGITLTGSTAAGRAVAALAGAALKKTVLELGGSDPYIVLEDADLEAATATCAHARLINSGQSCIAAKRFIVLESVLKEFEAGLVEQIQRRRWGNPRDESTELGPLARRELREQLHAWVEASVYQGARLLCGGRIPDTPGAFYPPTVLTNVRPGMPVFEEETFGPVAAIVPARDEAEAIQLANQSPYGLGAAIFTRDIARGERLAREHLDAGMCFINDHVRSDPRLPFGGIKHSGYGRELATFGLREFVNIKTVCVR